VAAFDFGFFLSSFASPLVGEGGSAAIEGLREMTHADWSCAKHLRDDDEENIGDGGIVDGWLASC
jgi:hypothetical protein